MGIGCCSSPERRQRSLDEQHQFSPRQLLEGPALTIAPDSIITSRGIPPGSAHRRPLVPSRLCHAVSAFRFAIKSCHDWRDGGTCPAGIGDCGIAGCSCGADEPLSFFICPGGVGVAADGEATNWGEDDLRDRDCRRWCRFKIFPANLASVSA